MAQRSGLTPRSLTAHLAGFALALVVPLLIFAAFGVFNFTQAEMTANAERLRQLATDVSKDIDGEISNQLTLLRALAVSDYLRQNNLAAFHEKAKSTAQAERTNVVLLDTSLRTLLDTRVPYEAQPPKAFDAATARLILDTLSPQISGLVPRPKPGKQRTLNLGVPIIQNGVPRYVLLMTFTPQRLRNAVLPSPLQNGSLVTISDRKDRIIIGEPEGSSRAHALAQPAGIGRSGTLVRRDANGERWFEHTHVSQLTGWRTTVGTPGKFLEAALWQSLQWIAATALLAGLLATLLASLLGRRMAGSMSKVTLAARKLASGGVIEPEHLPLSEADQVMKTLCLASTLIRERTDALQISEERSREQVEHIRLLMSELAHRNKNQLAVVQSMARQVGKGCNSIDEFLERFSSRLGSMVQSQELVFGRNRGDAPLLHLIREQLAPFTDVNGSRLVLNGPDVALTPEAAQTIGLAVHELATNATKYGALQGPEGIITVNWSVHENGNDRGLRLVWREHGGPAVRKPDQWGFGQVVIERLAAQTLNSRVSYEFLASGVVWTLEAPASVLAPPIPDKLLGVRQGDAT